MNLTATLLADFLKGVIEGNADVSIDKVEKIEEGKSGSLSFLANSKYENFLYETQSSIVLVANNLVLSKPVSVTLIRVENPYIAFSSVLETYFSNHSKKTGIEPNSFISETASLAENVFLGSFSYISENVVIGENSKIYPQTFIGDNVKIGKNCILYPGVKIYYDCQVGDNCIIHAGTVIGSDGFGFAPLPDGSYTKVPQTGNVIIGNNVEIGANSTIDRATLGSTKIHDGVKLDNLVQIAHNVEVGENTVIASQTGVSGSTKIGKNCVIAGQVGLVGHIEISDGVHIGGKAGVNHNLEKGQYSGSPVMQIKDWLRANVMLRKLPDMEKRLTKLEKDIKN